MQATTLQCSAHAHMRTGQPKAILACLIQELLVKVAAAQQEVALDRLKLAQQIAAVLHQVPQQG